MKKEEIEKRIKEIEEKMNSPDFWSDKDDAQRVIKEYQELKDELEGVGKYDRGDAVLSIYAGAGGDDAEDFAYMLFEMYENYINDRGWEAVILHEHKNDHGGYRNVSIEIKGKNVYGSLKHEAGVHRLVRISPFNAKGQRHTSFVLVDVVPKIEKVSEFEIPEDDLEISFARSSGPGGQNVNKRETAVRITHSGTGVSVHVDSERSQERNRDKAMEILRGKLYLMLQEEQKKEIKELSNVSDKSIEWGNQIRSYVLHPYKLVKDHRTDVEVRDVEDVFKGNLTPFVDAFKNLE